MARSINWNRVWVFARDEIKSKLSDQIFESSNLLKSMKGGGVNNEKGGQEKAGSNSFTISPILYGKNRASGYISGYSKMKIDPDQKFTEATYDWHTGYVNTTFSLDDEDAMVSDAAITNMVKTEMEVTTMSMQDIISTALFNDGSDSDAPHGLRKLIDTTSTVGGIDRSSYSWWQSNVMSDTTNYTKANLTNPSSDYYILDLFRSMWYKTKHQNMIPNVIVLSPGWDNVLEEEMAPYMEYRTSDVKEAKVDIASWSYKGKIPMIQDDYVPDGYCFWLNYKFLKMYVHRNRDMKLGEFRTPVDQMIRVAPLTHKFEFATNGPRYQGLIRANTDIEPS